MKYDKYGKSNKMASKIAFGGWQLGNTEFWGEMSFDYGVRLVKEAYDKGVTVFDTAPGYSNGLSERIIGSALKQHRSEVIINTKIGHLADGTSDFGPESYESQILASLDRLQTDYIDSVLLHNPENYILSGDGTHFKELERLKEKGLIKGYGVSIDTYEELNAVLNNHKVDVIELLFNVFFQQTLPLFDQIKEKGISLLIKVPLDSGWLTGKYDENSIFTGIRARWDIDTIKQRANLVKKLKGIVDDNVLTKYAIAFILSHNAVTSIITGVKSLEQLNENIDYEDFSINKEVIDKFYELYKNEIIKKPLKW